MKQKSLKLIEIALKIGALRVSVEEPFTWASGNRMPIYLDNRSLFSEPEARGLIISGLEEFVHKDRLPDSFCGCATGGIAPAACLSERFGRQFNYVRSGAKAHGLGKQVEGLPVDGLKTLIVEDLISTGGSSIAVVDAARASGAKVDEVVSIFTYGFPKSLEVAEEKSVNFRSVFGFDELFTFCQEEKMLDSDSLNSLKLWREDPFNWWNNKS